MRIAVTGATGRAGYPIARYLAGQGHEIVTLGRRAGSLGDHRRWVLGGPAPELDGIDALVHAAFSHVPGRYRGGEGTDPRGFVALNRDGTLDLFRQARTAGVGRIVFLSSRAVHDGAPKGTVLTDDRPARPDSLYGTVKADVEDWLARAAASQFVTLSVRATGIYGAGAPGQPHKWADLFDGHLAGQRQPSRIGTELHEDDLAIAIGLLLAAGASGTVNASDLLLDRHDLLAMVNAVVGRDLPLPPHADPASVSVMTCDRLRDLGWVSRGWDGLQAAVTTLLSDSG